MNDGSSQKSSGTGLPDSSIIAEKIIDTVREPMLVLENDLRVRMANESFYRHFKVREEETIGYLIYDLGNGQWDVPELRQLLENILKEDLSFNDYVVEHSFEHIGRRTMLLNGRRIDHLRLILLAMEDITCRQQSQDALLKNEEKFRKMFHLNTVPTVVSTLAEGRIIDINRAFEDVTEYTREETIGRTSFDLNLWLSSKERKRLADVLIKQGALKEEEFQIRTKSGKIKTFLASGDLIEIDGEQCLIASAVDITERKKAESNYLASERNFRAAFDHAPIGMVITDLEGNFLHVNDAYCRLTGYSQEELVKSGKNFKNYTYPEDLKTNIDEFKRLLRGEIPAYFLDKRNIRKNGDVIWVRASATVKRDSEGNPSQIVGIVEDITIQKQAQASLLESQKEMQKAKEAAEEANRAKSEFLANMSHEIRTPMTVFLAALEHLLHIDRNPEHRSLLEMADKSARHLRELIDDILDFSQIEARRVELHEEYFELRSWLKETVEMFRLPAEEKNIHLTTTVDESVPAILHGDSGRLKQVLINLIGNAIKFTEKGRIQISVREKNGLIEFEVADTGIGIPKDEQHLLFQSFSQVDSSLQRQYGGSGLGLAICKGIMDLMGGHISVQSKKGEGTSFTVAVALKTPQTAGDSTPDKAVSGEISPGTGRVLLVDDDSQVRQVMAMGLSQHGWQIAEAESGGHAVELWQQGDFDIVLMDLQMPEVDGLEATRRIRTLEKGESHTCIIGFTAHAQKKIINSCLETGMDNVLIKPVQLNELCATITECLKHQH